MSIFFLALLTENSRAGSLEKHLRREKYEKEKEKEKTNRVLSYNHDFILFILLKLCELKQRIHPSRKQQRAHMDEDDSRRHLH